MTIYKHYKGYNQELVPREHKNMQDAFQDWRDLLTAMHNRESQKAGHIMAHHLQRFLPMTGNAEQIRKIKQFLNQQNL